MSKADPHAARLKRQLQKLVQKKTVGVLYKVKVNYQGATVHDVLAVPSERRNSLITKESKDDCFENTARVVNLTLSNQFNRNSTLFPFSKNRLLPSHIS